MGGIARKIRRVLRAACLPLAPEPILLGPRAIAGCDRDRHPLRFSVPNGPVCTGSYIRMQAAEPQGAFVRFAYSSVQRSETYNSEFILSF
jgi:hypothetical protein